MSTNRPVNASYPPSTATKSSIEESTGSDSETAAEAPPDLDADDVFHILQTFRRRETIRYLLERNAQVKMRDVAEHVAAEEHDTTVDELTSAQRQRVYIPLYQSHLPKLDSAGIIEYDKPRGIVTPTDRLELFRPYLDATSSLGEPAIDDRREDVTDGQRYYATATAMSVGLLLAAAVGAGQVAYPGLLLGASITVLFVLATIGQFVEWP